MSVDHVTATLDLNLLVALDTLLRERSVTAAARHLGLTQSAMSHKLRRLREQLDDPLFISGRHGLTPTPRAQALEAPLRAALYDVTAALKVGAPFDPATAQRTFQIAAADLMELAILPEVLSRLEGQAPGLSILMRRRDRASVESLASGKLDLLIQPGGRSVPGFELEERAGIARKHLSDEGFSVVARLDHPVLAGRKKLTQKRYLEQGHVLVSPGGGDRGVVDQVLAPRGLTRRIAVSLPHFVAAPFLVARTDLLLTCPTSLARAAAEYAPLRVMEPPFELPRTQLYMYWHQRFQHDAGHRWLRDFVVGLQGGADSGH